MLAVESFTEGAPKKPPARRRFGLNLRLLAALAFDLVAWGLILAVGWIAIRLL